MNNTVWYISKYFEPKTSNSPGGRGWHILRELVNHGCQPVVISSNSNNLIDEIEVGTKVKKEVVERVTIIWLKTLKYGVAKSYLRVLSWFHFEWNLLMLNKKDLPKPDVIVVSSLSLLTVLNGVYLKWKYNCRLVFEVRDIWPLTIVEEGGASAKNPFVIFLGWVEKFGYRMADSIIGTMPNLVEHVREVGCEKPPVYCIPMGVSETQLEAGNSISKEYKEKYLSGPEMKVVHAGTVGITNALDIFFEAATALKECADIKFILVGDGALKQSYIKKFGHLNNLVFAPKVKKNEVISVLNECDVVYFSTFPSKVWDYGQSLNKVIDYMLSQKPVVASYSGFPSMINESECGEFVPAGDADALVAALVKYCKLTEEERAMIGNKGRDWLLKHRSYKKLAIDYKNILFGK